MQHNIRVSGFVLIRFDLTSGWPGNIDFPAVRAGAGGPSGASGRYPTGLLGAGTAYAMERHCPGLVRQVADEIAHVLWFFWA